MVTIFNALPGIEVPVGGIKRHLADMWTDTAASGGAAPSAKDAKATQVNLVLHLGLPTTVDDALAQFAVVEKFSQQYPSRIVVLCPLTGPAAEGVTDMRAKIFGQCYLGKHKDDARCVEFVILSYPPPARVYLENQVSICLSTDLPLYYWAHRFAANAKLADYRYLLGRARRVLIDSSIAPSDAKLYPLPRPEVMRDLVYSRLLPVRQSLGQFLAGYTPAQLVGGLCAVTMTHGADLAAEARVLTGWLQRRLAACGAQPVEFHQRAAEPGRLGAEFTFADKGKYFRWLGDLRSGHANFACDFGGGETKLSASFGLLPPERALSEAMFF